MKLSKTSEYALRILGFMAKEPEKLYSAKYLIDNLHISDKYLRRLLTALSKSGFIKSIQGRDGGYSFDKGIDKILLIDILEAVDGKQKYSGCILGFDQCSDENPCIMHSSWVSVRDKFDEVFRNKSLSDLDYNEISKF